MTSLLTAEHWPVSGTATALAVGFATLYAVLYSLQSRKSNAGEPPIIPSAVPFVGHLLGMALQGGSLRNRSKPIFTLPLPGGARIYVVTDPALAAAVQRASKTLSFTPLIPGLTSRVLGLDTPTVTLISQHLDPEPGDPRGFLADMHDMVYGYLGPGAALDDLTLVAARELCGQINMYAAALQPQQQQQQQQPVELLGWIRRLVTTSSAGFLYGPDNPLARQPELVDALADFDHGLGGLLLNVFPALTCPKAYHGREALVHALAEHLATASKSRRTDDAVSDLIRRRLAIARQYGWASDAIGREELSFLFAVVVNTATTAFWLVLRLFADADLLAAVRRELAQAAVDEEDDNKNSNSSSLPPRQLRLDAVKSGCPMLLSAFREVLRLGSDNYSTRLVKSDTLLAGRWHLCAQSVVQIAGGVIHADTAIWGADAANFDPYRFLPAPTAAPADTRTTTANGSPRQPVHPAAFRAFGGGKTLCPGRHFATHEILALTALIVLTFDIEAVDGGALRVPPKDDGVLPVHILEPKAGDLVRVQIKPLSEKQVRPWVIV